MIIHLTYPPIETIKKFIIALIQSKGIPVKPINATYYRLEDDINKEKYKNLLESFQEFGICINEDPKEALVAEIKIALMELLEEGRNDNLSEYLCKRINYSYSHLTKIFKEETFTSIEDYLIYLRLRKVRSMAKQGQTLTEISYKLGYSSVAHLSRQFKKHTGLSYREYQQLIERNTRER